MKSVVYVLAPDRRPLMPCSCIIARLLLKEGKAKVLRSTPFTIKLLAEPATAYTQPITLGIDTGSTVIGSAVSTDQGHVVYLSEITVRNDIAETMKERATYRHNRKTRYRPARWLNRRNSIRTARFSPRPTVIGCLPPPANSSIEPASAGVGPDCVPVPSKSPGRKLHPLIV